MVAANKKIYSLGPLHKVLKPTSNPIATCSHRNWFMAMLW